MSDDNELQRSDTATGNSCVITLTPNPNPKYMYSALHPSGVA